MPAVTVPDLLVLPRIPRPDRSREASRPVVSVTSAPRGLEGEGFPVRRAFAGVDLTALDPFVHMDQMGEVEYAPGEPKGTPWHPHRGFQWMTAGAGILHIERPPEEMIASGGLFHGIQLWVNLPAAKKWVPPRYQDIGAQRVTLLTSADGTSLVRVIAGDVAGESGPGVTHTAMAMVHATLTPGAVLELPWAAGFNALVYVLSGRGSVGEGQAEIRAGQLAVLGSGDFVTLAAAQRQESRAPALDVLILGGQPIREPVAAYGPFVMNRQDELAQAFEDYRAGRLGTVPADHIGNA
jgi:hypothetical protein